MSDANIETFRNIVPVLSLFKNSFIVGIVSDVFSYPPTLMLDKATLSELKSYLGITDRRQTLLLCLVQSLLQNGKRPQNADASA